MRARKGGAPPEYYRSHRRHHGRRKLGLPASRLRVIGGPRAAVPAPDREAIRALQGVLEERDRTIAAHEATIRDLRARLDSEVEERRRVQERLTALLTHRQTGSVPSVQRPETTVSTLRVPWWRRWFR